MSILFGLDSSGTEASVCILRESGVLFEEEIDEGLTHSETLLPLVRRALAGAGLAPGDISAWAVSAGPGSFTGLRIGLSLVKGMAFPTRAPLAPVSTLEAIARALPPLEGTLVPALNARRGEVYWATFAGDGGRARLEPDRAGPAETLADIIFKYPEPIIFVGSGAEMCYTLYTDSYAVAPSPPRWPIARGVALAGAEMARRGLLVPAGQARPSYLRLSQAERERKKRLETENPNR